MGIMNLRMMDWIRMKNSLLMKLERKGSRERIFGKWKSKQLMTGDLHFQMLKTFVKKPSKHKPSNVYTPEKALSLIKQSPFVENFEGCINFILHNLRLFVTFKND